MSLTLNVPVRPMNAKGLNDGWYADMPASISRIIPETQFFYGFNFIFSLSSIVFSYSDDAFHRKRGEMSVSLFHHGVRLTYKYKTPVSKPRKLRHTKSKHNSKTPQHPFNFDSIKNSFWVHIDTGIGCYSKKKFTKSYRVKCSLYFISPPPL